MSITIKNLHKDLPEDQLHEGKGFTTASNNTYLKKNHEGSSEWLSESWLQPVKGVVSGSSAPPSESSGDRYILTGSSFHANWDTPSQFEIVEFNGTSWIGQAAVDGMRVADLSDDSVYYFNTAWVQSGDTDTTYTAGDGLDLTSTTFSIDAKANGGLVIESTELAVDLGASSITGTLAVSDGGTGAATHTANGVLIGNGTSAIASVDMSTKGHILIGDGSGNPSMLAIGTDDHVLTADSSEATGVKWAAAAGGGASAINDLSDGITSATNNIGLGSNAIDSISSGDRNVGLGIDAGTAITSGSQNTCIGDRAGTTLQTGSNNTFIGGATGLAVGTADANNTMIGQAAGQNVDGSSNTFLGQNAGQGSGSTSTITSNTFVGCGVGATITSGDYNTMIAGLVGSAITSGGKNTLIGRVGGVTTGSSNVGLGYHAFSSVSTGSGNILIGTSDGTANFDPSAANPDNEFWIGSTASSTERVLMNGSMSAANQCKIGINNTSLPTATLHVKGQGTTIATTSFLVEDSAGVQIMKITDSGNNIAIGKNANKDASTDTYNVALGESALFTSAGGDHNFASGYQSQYSLTTGQENIAIGNSALRTNATAGYNICLGRHAGYAVTGAGNVIIGGYNTGNAVAAGTYNTILGYQSGDTITSGSKNITIGYRADAAATASNQIAIGDEVVCTGADQLKIGSGSVHAIAADLSSGAVTINNAYTLPTAVTGANDYVLTAQTDGSTAWAAASGGGSGLANFIETATDNFGVGSGCLDSITTGGAYNTGIGVNAGTAVSTGDQNIAIGWNAAQTLTTGSYNTVIGDQTLTHASSAAVLGNVIMGTTAGNKVTSNYNVYLGYGSGKGPTGGNGAQHNVGVGYFTLEDCTSQGWNAAVGSAAGRNVTSGQQNTIIGGYITGQNVTTGIGNTIIGSRCEVDGDVNYQTALGYLSDTTGIYGIAIGYDVTAGTNDCVIGKNGNTITCDFDTDGTWTQSSDERKKDIIADDTLGLDFINALTPKTYKWKAATEHPEEWGHFALNESGEKEYPEMNTDTVMHGLIAQDVKSALDAAGVDTFGGWSEDANGQQQISKSMFVIPLIKAVKELTTRLEALENA
mgnify:CR=1 FL=1